ncbi:conjugal transfer pilus assembly protein TraU [Nitrospirillum amazonense]|uniref:conjugal transfer pilus assembly protein TraU n=1 Tax=Nitrospirillum amazonense TaxID=28077 RepID=UPI00241230D6|nr:conjugal transfer pilus assembly protein TraU [Nitrospirillum amazonense]MDG3444542.1 conjugal transfer pilus assembly protein TraU [Nitrospirillum amazonense]
MKRLLRSLAIALVVVGLFGTPRPATASCTGAFVNPITDICWSCLFPLTIGSITLIGGDRPDTPNPDFPICACPIEVPPFVRLGIAVGFWEPVRLVDVTHDPWCMVNLGGIQLAAPFKQGSSEPAPSLPGGVNNANWQVHWYIYPVMYWLELLMDFICIEQSTFDIAYLTEIDPMWMDDEMTFLLNPEAVLFDNPIAQAACAVDCAATTASGLALDPLFWCAGCQGSMYPLDGQIQGENSEVQGSLLMAERMAYKLHRELILWGSMGSDGMCARYPMPVIRKSQYRFQLVNPVPNSNGDLACPSIGTSTVLYEGGKMVPQVGENFGYLLWRKRNCCVF